MSYVHAFPSIRSFFSIYLLYLNCVGTFLIVSLSPSLSSVCISLCLWPLNASLLCPRTLFLLGHPLRSECQVILADFIDTNLLDVIHSRGFESLRDVPVTCLSVLIQEFYSNMHGFDYSVPHFFTRVRGTRIAVTPQIVADVLHVLSVEFPNYPGCERLKTVSKDELKSNFCECPSNWGERQFTYCLGFAKGPRFLQKTLFLTITLSQSLMLDFCCPFLSILPSIFLLTLFFLS